MKNIIFEKQKKFVEFDELTKKFLEDISETLTKYSPAVVYYSFLSFLATVCITKSGEEFVKGSKHRFESCKDFFHHQLDEIYEEIKERLKKDKEAGDVVKYF